MRYYRIIMHITMKKPPLIPVALGLGSNCGARVAHLQAALNALVPAVLCGKVQVSRILTTPALLKEGAPAEWNQPFYNIAIVGQTALAPEELLAAIKQIEKHLGRQARGVWAPREIDIDILLYSQQTFALKDLQIPHVEMLNRDFVILPLADIAGDWQHPETGKSIAAHAAEFSAGDWVGEADLNVPSATPNLMGILNLTPDSFSSDGLANAGADAVLTQAEAMLKAGASALDVGAESTRPNAEALTAEQEWQRLEAVWKDLRALTKKYNARLSVDTRHAATAEQCLNLGVDIINDVTGLRDAAMLEVVRSADCQLAVMHSLSVPVNPAETLPIETDMVAYMKAWMTQMIERLAGEGIAPTRLLLDPGISFGLAPAQSWRLLETVREWRAYGVPLLIGHSRKSFLKTVTDADAKDRDAATLDVSAALAQQGVEWLRVHNIAAHMAQREEAA